MAEIFDWDVDANNNNDAVPDGFPEGMPPSGVNNAAREVMAVVGRYYQATSGVLQTTGSATAYALATNQVVNTYADGMPFTFRAHITNTGSATLNINGAGAVDMVLADGGALPASYIRNGGVYWVVHANNSFFIVNGLSADTIRGFTPAPNYLYIPYSGAATHFNTTWTKPANLKRLWLRVVAGGGGGESGAKGVPEANGGAGASSAVVTATFDEADLASTEDVSIGRGGTAGVFAPASFATDGFSTSFGTLIDIPGADRGGDGSNAGSGLGGTATPNGSITLDASAVSSLIFPSVPGGAGPNIVSDSGAPGGLSFYGGAGYVGAGSPIIDSTGPGTGGYGGLTGQLRGGNGGNGFIELIEYF